jgi:hypothetical protein
MGEKCNAPRSSEHTMSQCTPFRSFLLANDYDAFSQINSRLLAAHNISLPPYMG